MHISLPKNGKALVNDEASHHALRKLAGIGLYCSQQKRDGKRIEYNNPGELLDLVEASRTLKGVHPDLYDKYQVQANLEKLCLLQPKNSLQNRIQQAMENIDREEKEDNVEKNREKDTMEKGKE